MTFLWFFLGMNAVLVALVIIETYFHDDEAAKNYDGGH
jgi:hypothetical protein